jgi:site-specific DNA recombinase
MLKYFIYCRKSTEDRDRQILSIDAQLFELRAIAVQHGIAIVATFKETKSAKEAGRPVFNEMMDCIERGEANAILAWKLDRLARNFDDGGKIIGLLQRGAIKEIRTFEKAYLPTDNVLMIAVEMGMANQYVRDLSVNVQRGLREKTRRGIFCGKAPLGYYNEPKIRTIEPHAVFFPEMKRVLELFAAGNHSLTTIQHEMTKVGLLGGRRSRPIYLSALTKILRNPFYYGAFLYKGELHQGTHLPMITKKTYDDIQDALIANGKPRKRREEKKFTFLDFATCGCCGFSITAERHTKKSGLRFDYYRCTYKSKQRPCNERLYVRADDLAAEVKQNMELVALPDEWKERLLARIETWEGEASKVREHRANTLKGELAALKVKMDRINSAFADGTLGIDEFREMKNPLIPLKIELERQIAGFEDRKANWLEPMKNWILEANTGVKWLSEANYPEMKSFLKKVGSNRLLQGKKLTISFQEPWNLLAKTVTAARQRDENNPLGSQLTLECSFAEELRTYFEANVLNDKVSPHPSPQGEALQSEKTLQNNRLMVVLPSPRPPTASVSPQGFTASASTHAPASANLGRLVPRTTGSRGKLLYLKIVESLSPCFAAVYGGE